MNNKHILTLAKIYQRPTPADIRWQDIISLLEAVGVEISQGSGSRVRLKKGVEKVEKMVIHRPHPSPGTGKNTVRDIAKFLETIGIVP